MATDRKRSHVLPAFVNAVSLGKHSRNIHNGPVEPLHLRPVAQPRSAPHYRRVHVSWRRCTLAAEPSGSQSPSSSSSDADNDQDGREPAFDELKERLKRVNIFLVGMMGSGKSTVGRQLARGLGYKFLDTDQIIEDLTQKSITEIFETEGEEKFRTIERAVLNEVQAFVGCVVSTGGGIVQDKENWGPLQTGLVVWLNASTAVLLTRVMNDKDRPLLQVEDPAAKLETLLEERRTMYSMADVTTVAESDTPVSQTTFEVVRLLNNFIKSHPPRWADQVPNLGTT